MTMTDIIPTPHHDVQRAASEVGMSLIDVATVLYVLQQTGGPQNLIACLESAVAQMCVAGTALEAVKAGLMIAVEQRDEAIRALTQAKIKIEQANMHRETAKEDLAQLEYDLDTWNTNNPAVAKLVNEVWTQAQQALINERALQGEA